jgi:mRNA interferase MazF
MTVYNFGDIILIGFPHTDLEGTSKRPAVVLFDSGDEDVLVTRITTQEYTSESDYKILNWKESGLLAESYIRLGKQATLNKRYIIKQLGVLSSKEDVLIIKISNIYMIPKEKFLKVCHTYRRIGDGRVSLTPPTMKIYLIL